VWPATVIATAGEQPPSGFGPAAARPGSARISSRAQCPGRGSTRGRQGDHLSSQGRTFATTRADYLLWTFKTALRSPPPLWERPHALALAFARSGSSRRGDMFVRSGRTVTRAAERGVSRDRKRPALAGGGEPGHDTDYIAVPANPDRPRDHGRRSHGACAKGSINPATCASSIRDW
jgi:hypothetical protein